MNPICTSFIIQSDGRTTHSIEKYTEQYKRLRVSCNNKIVLFLDSAVNPEEFKHHNTAIFPIDIRSLRYYDLFHRVDSIVHCGDNPAKNTAGFHTIMNSKINLCLRAADYLGTNQISWIDFGIGHVIKNEGAFQNLHKTNRLQDGLVFPGCWPRLTNYVSPISWRFCGGYFHADVYSLKRLDDVCNQIIHKIYPHVTWEVNIWAIAEANGISFKWYKADHNDTIFDFDQYLGSSP